MEVSFKHFVIVGIIFCGIPQNSEGACNVVLKKGDFKNSMQTVDVKKSALS